MVLDDNNSQTGIELACRKPMYIGHDKTERKSKLLGTFSTDGFEDGYGELNRAGTGMPGANRPKARENRNSLATKTIPVTTERHGYKTR